MPVSFLGTSQIEENSTKLVTIEYHYVYRPVRKKKDAHKYCMWYIQCHSYILWKLHTLFRFCRHEDWNSAERWLLAAENIHPEHRNSMRYVQASLKLAECYLLGYCRVLSPQRIHSRASNEAKRNTKKVRYSLKFPQMYG